MTTGTNADDGASELPYELDEELSPLDRDLQLQIEREAYISCGLLDEAGDPIQ